MGYLAFEGDNGVAGCAGDSANTVDRAKDVLERRAERRQAVGERRSKRPQLHRIVVTLGSLGGRLSYRF